MNRALRLSVIVLLALAGTPGVVSAGAKQATKMTDDLATLVPEHAAARAARLPFRSSRPFYQRLTTG